MKIAALQLANLPYDKAKIDYYIALAKKNDAKLIVIGEYVLNLFFKDFAKTSKKLLKEQSKHQFELFKRLAKSYNVKIIAPMVIFEKDKYYKVIVKFSPKNTNIYYQQILMPYSHWNEKTFFKYNKEKKNDPIIFTHENLKIGVISGFEAHFTEYWQYMKNKNVNVVLVPSVATFGSKQRWRDILQTFAFLNNMYVIRVNRVGEWEDWEFYGDSFAINPEGGIEDNLTNKEEILISDIDENYLKEINKLWKFKSLSKNIKLD